MIGVLGSGRVVQVDDVIVRKDGTVKWFVQPDGSLVDATNAMLVEDYPKEVPHEDA